MDAPVVRIVLFRFADAYRTTADRAAVVEEARSAFPTFPGVTTFRAGTALDEDQDVLFVIGFASEADVEPYRISDGHVAFVRDWIQARGATVLARTFRMDAN